MVDSLGTRELVIKYCLAEMCYIDRTRSIIIPRTRRYLFTTYIMQLAYEVVQNIGKIFGTKEKLFENLSKGGEALPNRVLPNNILVTLLKEVS